MNFDLTDDQLAMREAARDALGRVDSLAAAREALDGHARADLWPICVAAGWPGLLVPVQRGGVELDALDAMLIMWECGRVLAAVPLIGHLVATALLSAAAGEDAPRGLVEGAAAGDVRCAYLPAAPPSDLRDGWTTDSRSGHGRRPGLQFSSTDASVTGELAFVPDVGAADVLVGVATDADEHPRVVVLQRASVDVDPLVRFDATRDLAHVTADAAPAQVLDVPDGAPAAAWYLAQALLAAESLGAVETALQTTVEYARERFTFGRSIGSYQAIKHMLVEVLRQLENGRSLMFFAGWSRGGDPAEFALAASALRVAAGSALDHAARTMIAVHGGIGATWEHDTHLFFRRAQLTRRLLGGIGASADRVAGEMLRRVAA